MALINGTAGNDTRVGTAAADTISGQAGNDMLEGREGHDLVFGGAGLDTLRGQGGNDRLYGEAGNDWLRGGTGHDRLFGGDGDDRLDGEQGNDTLDGGAGSDVLDSGDVGNETDAYACDARTSAAGDLDTFLGFDVVGRDVLRLTDRAGQRLTFTLADSNRDGKVTGADALFDDTRIAFGSASYKALGVQLDGGPSKGGDAAFEVVISGIGPNGGPWDLSALGRYDFG